MGHSIEVEGYNTWMVFKSRLLPLLATLLIAGGASVNAQTVYTTDLVVQGQACMGFDCSSGPVSGSDTIQLLENNTRVGFQTPNANFRLTANESANGGDEEFRIDQLVTQSGLGSVVISDQAMLPGTIQGDGRLLIPNTAYGGARGEISFTGDPNEDVTDVETTFDSEGIVETYLPAGSFTNVVGTIYRVVGDQTVQNAAGDPAQIPQTATGYVSAVTFSAANNSVALGRGTVAAANTVSVGASGSERRITGVATPTGPNDLVPLSYFQSALRTPANAQAQEIKALEKRNRDVAAMSAAFSALQPNPRGSGGLALSIGLGHYDSRTAGAVGVIFSPNSDQQVRVGLSSTGNSQPQFNLSGRIQW